MMLLRDIAFYGKADLLDLRADSERSFVAHNVLKSAAVLERQQADAD